MKLPSPFPSSSSQFPVFSIIILTILVNIIPTVTSLHSYNNITFYGDSYNITNTTTNTTSIFLTNQEPSSFGGAFYAYPIRFLESQTHTPLSFYTRFSFTIAATSVIYPAEGISFLITSNVGSFNREYGHLGLPELSLSSHDSFVAIEFDTKFDSFVNDINGNHVGVDVYSYSSLVSADGFSSGVSFSSGKRIYAWIEYKNLGKLVNVWISYSSDKPQFPALSAQIDLSNHLKEFMYVGFVASNGRVAAFYVVDSWRFKTFEADIFASNMSPLDEGNGTVDCMICFPKVSGNFSANSGANSSTNDTVFEVKGGKKGFLTTAIGVTIAIVLCFLAALVGLLILKPVKTVQERELGVIPRTKSRKGAVKLSLSEIKSATCGFSKIMIIGQGASSTVYKGVFGDDQVVAVKRFNQVNNVDITRPFTTELSTMARCLRHTNLVQLLGWCCEGNELVLVYEYLPNGSLDHILYKTPGFNDSVSLLSWEHRMKIVLGIASGLTYLHEECDRQIIHRDVKACNVMLDSDFTPKLGDFGLAEVYDRASNPKSRKSTLPAGTMGYLAPEYVYHGVPTVKSDVYSFGVVMLEVVSGKRAVEEGAPRIVDWAWTLWEKGTLSEAVDDRLHGKYSRDDMKRMFKVGLCCVNADSEKRPTAKEAAMMLRDELPIPGLPVKKPNLELRNVRDHRDDVSQRTVSGPLDDMSESFWATPGTHFGNE